MLNQDAPLPPDNDPTPDDLGSLSYAVLDLEGCMPDLKVQEDVYAIGNAVLAKQGQEELAPEAEHPDLDALLLTTQKPRPGGIRPRAGTRLQAATKSIASRCAPCRFAGVLKVLAFLVVNPYCQPMLILCFQSECDGAVGSVCTRCRRLESKVPEETRRRARKWLDGIDGAARYLPEFLVEPAESLSLPKVLFFELSMFSPLCSPTDCPCKVNMAGISRSTAASRRSA